MGKIETLSNLNHIDPLLKLACLTGQYQPNNVEANYENIKWYKCYTLAIVSLVIGAYAIMQMDHFSTEYFPNTTAVIMNFMTITIFTIGTLYSMIGNVLLNPSKFHSALGKMAQIDALLRKIQNSKIVESKMFILKIVLQHVAIFTIIAFNIVWGEVLGGNKLLKTNYLLYFEQYHSYVCFLLITNCFGELKNRFRSMNLSLLAIFAEKDVEKISDNKISKYVETITISYGILSETVDLFNDLFGWQILIIFVYTLISLLTSLNMIALFIPKYEDISKAEDINTGLFIVVLLNFTVFFIINNYILAKLADNIYEESKQTSTICYKILQELKLTPISSEEHAIREKLSFLAQEATLRCTKLSAAGFFEVDFTMVFLLFTSVTTYIVVLIQFNL